MRIGIDLGGTKIEAIVLAESGEEVFRERVPTPQGDYQGTLKAVASLVSDADQRLKLPEVPVGVGTPGALSPSTGNIKNSNSTCLIGMPLDKDLAQILNRPVRLANDANCFALSEAMDGAGSEGRIVFGVILGTGVGGGIVFDKKLLDGPNAISGEWGHNPLPWPTPEETPGPKCYCGLNGCIETFLSGVGLERDHKKRTGVSLLGSDISRSEPETMQRYELRLAKSLASIINVLDPNVIVLGGGVSNCDRLYENVPKLWDQFVFSDRVDTQLKKANFGDSSGVRGAAWLWG